MMMPADDVKVLRPKLERAQKALEAALEEACETEVSSADTTELLRLEESLTVAREAARNAIDVLRTLHRDRQEAEESPSGTHRLFVDDSGVEWDAFCVYPSRPTSGRSTLPAPYDKGWLSIQCQEEIRRVTPIPEGWRELPRAKLCEIVSKAVPAPRRERSRETKSSDSEARV
jgi:hypothetical protein